MYLLQPLPLLIMQHLTSQSQETHTWVSYDTDPSLDDSTAFPTEQCIDLYDGLSVFKLISIRKFQKKRKNKKRIIA